jgi:hypothetical protein
MIGALLRDLPDAQWSVVGEIPTGKNVAPNQAPEQWMAQLATGNSDHFYRTKIGVRELQRSCIDAHRYFPTHTKKGRLIDL